MAVTLIDKGFRGTPPGSITGNQLWYDAQALVYEDGGATDPAEDTDPVAAWVDRTNAYTVTGGTPLYAFNTVNGYRSLDWDTVNDVMTGPANTADQFQGTSNTGFVVVKYDDAIPAQQQTIFGFFDGTRHTNTVYNTAGAATINASNYDGAADVATKAFTPTVWNVFTYMNNGSNVYIGVNDTRTASMTATVSGNTTVGANTQLYIRVASVAYKNMNIAEFAFFNVALAEADRQQVEIYLAYKYGITLPY